MVANDTGLDLRRVNRDNVRQVLAQDRKVDIRYGFLHIPKTGGTSFVDFLAKIDHMISSRPVLFFHSWNLPLIVSYIPEIRVSFAIRDPIERLISGFQSRLRSGQPRYNQPWRPYEAAAFSLFPNVRDLLDGLLKDDERSISASNFAVSHIIAIAWNYEHYFHSAEEVVRCRENIHIIGETEEMSSFHKKICSSTITISGQDISHEDIFQHYEIKHKSEITSKQIISEYSEGDMNALRSRLQKEYEIYDRLKKISRETSYTDSSGTM